MDLVDILWNASQQASINELRAKLTATRATGSTTLARHVELERLMQEENDDLRLRLGVLVRLLIEQGVISTEQYGAAVQEAKTAVAQAAEALTKRGKSTTRALKHLPRSS